MLNPRPASSPLAVPASTKVPKSWNKTSSTKAVARYTSPEILPLIRSLQEARETRGGTVKAFIKRLFGEFDNDRVVWLKAVKTSVSSPLPMNVVLISFFGR